MLLSYLDFSHGKFGSLFPRKASSDCVVLLSLQSMLFFSPYTELLHWQQDLWRDLLARGGTFIYSLIRSLSDFSLLCSVRLRERCGQWLGHFTRVWIIFVSLWYALGGWLGVEYQVTGHVRWSCKQAKERLVIFLFLYQRCCPNICEAVLIQMHK